MQLALDAHRIVGAIGLKRHGCKMSTSSHPWRGQGYGDRLLATMLSELAALHVRNVLVGADEVIRNTAATARS